MNRGFRTWLWILLGGAAAARIALAFATYGYAYDINSFLIVDAVLRQDGLDAYGVVNAVQPVFRWPYPPGFFPEILAAGAIERGTGIPLHGTIQLPAIAADLGLAWLVQHYLAVKGAGERVRMMAAGTIALGPLFLLVSGYHGQIDSLAILPAVGALMLWERGGERRWLWCGLLIGLGAALKIVPGFALLALLPSMRTRREGIATAATAVAVPALALAPFLAADPEGIRTIFEYRGGPGQGGLTLLLQPNLADFYVRGAIPEFNPAVEFLFERGVIVNLLTLAGLALLLFARRPEPVAGMVLVWVALWVTGTSFFFHYLIWGLPFLIMAGRLGTAITIQLVVAVPALIFYLGPWETGLVLIPFVGLMVALWLALAVWLVAMVRRTLRYGEGAGARLLTPPFA